MNTLWEIPVPSTSFYFEPKFEQLVGRDCSLTMEYEDEDLVIRLTLILSGVEAFKCTYLYSCNYDYAGKAYDHLVDYGETFWLHEIKETLSQRVSEIPELKHMGIYFDDGPFYEFVCVGYEIKKESRKRKGNFIISLENYQGNTKLEEGFAEKGIKKDSGKGDN